jgi:hypothetical protein
MKSEFGIHDNTFRIEVSKLILYIEIKINPENGKDR